MTAPQSRLLSIDGDIDAPGGAEVLFREQKRLFEGIDWNAVPSARRQSDKRPGGDAASFADGIEFGTVKIYHEPGAPAGTSEQR
jgi:hypothetical protein